jgi:beta-galactosidase/beta-glucuronidase
MKRYLLTGIIVIVLVAVMWSLQSESASMEYPYKTALITRWGSEVTPENAWTEYPRPQLAREAWQNLNGLWDYAITSASEKNPPEQWAGQILVPFALESRLGGVQRLLQPEEALWYRRTVEVTATEGKRTLLNFEAVDYRCEVFVNGVSVGGHQGGNTPFSLEITDAMKEGANEILVRVEDETGGWQLRGKQVLEPKGIWYTRVSGIWQTVWLEQVPGAYIEDLTLNTDAAAGTVQVAAKINGAENISTLRVIMKDAEETVAAVQGDASGLTLRLDSPKLWTPDSPHLYGLEIELLDGDGNPVDRVTSYTGIRSVGKMRDAEGHLRFTLNGEPIFHWGPLDQGWWPDGLLTPPSDEAMRYDIEYLKAAGFNMIRKHIKVEPRRYYYHCDRLGMMLWQDQPSGGVNPRWVFMSDKPVDADWPDEQHAQYMYELERMMDSLKNSPAIVVWVPFNEAWGQHRSVEVGEWVMQRDPSRLVNIASGGNFFPVGDIADAHAYPDPRFPFNPERFNDFIKVVGEFGGHGFPVEGHLWNPDQKNWGYGKKLPESLDEYKERFRNTLGQLNQLRQEGIAAGVYTQTTDVEVEINGLLTYDREVAKIAAEELAEIRKEFLPNLGSAK